MLNVIVLSVAFHLFIGVLNVIILSVVRLKVVRLNVVKLSVVAPNTPNELER